MVSSTKLKIFIKYLNATSVCIEKSIIIYKSGDQSFGKGLSIRSVQKHGPNNVIIISP